MQLNPRKHHKLTGFTFAEVIVAVAVCAIFGAAVFATNQRLLIALKAQRETTAATLLLQERMEKFRGFTYSNIGDSTYVSTNVLGSTTTSESALPNMTETITVRGYMDTSGATPTPSPAASPTATPSPANVWTRDSAHPTGNQLYTNSTLATSYDLLQVMIKVQWTSSDGRSRVRELSALFGKGNIGN
jgi:Tfp pilus assembly protein PilE